MKKKPMQMVIMKQIDVKFHSRCLFFDLDKGVEDCFALEFKMISNEFSIKIYREKNQILRF